MEGIKNYNIYTTGMQKSLEDKLFFTDKVDNIKGLVDFGCADGSLIDMINTYDKLNGVKLIGYDINPDMIELAKDVVGSFTTDFKEALHLINPSESVLNLSSVIHEVYSYSLDYALNSFWGDVFGSGFKYVAIRDFCISESINRVTDINDYTKLIQGADKNQIRDYESIWGSLRNNRNMVHFLMKYRYIENWDREVRENYFPITLEQMLSKIPTNEYEIIYFEDYILPFTKNKVKDDLDITLHDTTHVKLLLKRKD